MDALIFNTLQRVQAEKDEAKQGRAQGRDERGARAALHASPADMEELAYDLFNLAWSDAGRATSSRPHRGQDGRPRRPDYVEEDLRGMRAYWQGKGGQIRSDIIRYERAQMPREEIVSAIDMHQDELNARLLGLVRQALDAGAGEDARPARSSG
jgi:hypothetical protein